MMKPEILNPIAAKYFLFEPRIRSPYELGLLCLSVLWMNFMNLSVGLVCVGDLPDGGPLVDAIQVQVLGRVSLIAAYNNTDNSDKCIYFSLAI